MSLETILTEFRDRIEASIVEYGEQGSEPPVHLLQTYSYLINLQGQSSQTSAGGTADFTETNNRIGSRTETASTSSAAASGLNGLVRFLVNLINRFTFVGTALKTDSSAVTQPVSGSVAVNNLPETQPISGNVFVGNFPVTQPVSGSVSVGNFPASQLVSGSVSVSNLPATQPVSGVVSVENLPLVQLVSGNVSVGNFPATQPISATTLPLPVNAASEITLAILRDRTPVLGQATAANSIPVALSSDGAFAANFGLSSAAAATTDTASASFLSLFKRLLERVTAIIGLLPTALSNGRFLVESAITATVDAAVIAEAALTASGSTPARSAVGYKELSYQIDASAGVTNAVLRMEGQLTGSSGFVNLNASGINTIITTPGSYLFGFSGKVSQVRMTLVSIAGTTPSITAYLLRGN